MYVEAACSRECNLGVQATLQTHQKRARAHTNKTKLSLSLGSCHDCFTARQLSKKKNQRKKIREKKSKEELPNARAQETM